MQGRIAKLVVYTLEVRWTCSKELSRATLIQDRCAQLEDLCQFHGQLLCEWLASVDQENRTAKRVQTLNILLPLNRVEGLPFGFRGQAACCQGGRQEAKQSNPVLRVGDRERSGRREKEEVEAQRSRN